MSEVNLTVDSYELHQARWSRGVLDAIKVADNPTYMLRSEASVSKDSSEDDFAERYCLRSFLTEERIFNGQHSTSRLFIDEETRTVLDCDFEGKKLTYLILAHCKEHAHNLRKKVSDFFDKPKKKSSSKVRFAFWQNDVRGCNVQYSDQICPTLEDIEVNYSKKIIDSVNQLISMKAPHKRGKIILWHGPAGNGKTFLIRALCREWYKAFGITPEVIIDPEELFSRSKYLTSLFTKNPHDSYYESKKQPFRLIIAEDCAELFSAGCRNERGFSRLLNTADGLLGQGQNLVFLFTANESIDQVDKAILRPGRCLMNLEVKNWTQPRAEQWLKLKSLEDKIEKIAGTTVTLASLYALLNDVEEATQQQEVLGFKL